MNDLRFELQEFPDADQLAEAAAVQWITELERGLNPEAPYCVAISGGRISHAFFRSITAAVLRRQVSFDRVHFFWADERCVPPDHSESNFKTARELLFQPLGIRADRIHRVRGEDAPETAAQEAARELEAIAARNGEGKPVLDMIFLGLGEDGHVASLFPGRSEEAESVYHPVYDSPKPPPVRVSVSYHVISWAKEVWMLASGEGKEEALRDSLSGHGNTPFARVLGERRRTRIFTDISL